VSARVFVGPGTDVVGGQTALGGGTPLILPAGASIYGPVSVRGPLENRGYIEGDITSPGLLVAGNHSGEVTFVPVEAIPSSRLLYSDYVTYRLDGTTHTAARISGTLSGTSTLANGLAATPENPAGVVVIEIPRGGRAVVSGDTHFTGTIVVNGDLYLDGANIRLRSQAGFPAIVCSGAVYVVGSTQAEVIGMVAAVFGIKQSGNNTTMSKTRIQGPLITQSGFYDDQLSGTHELCFDPDAGRLYDVVTGANPCGVVRILDWFD